MRGFGRRQTFEATRRMNDIKLVEKLEAVFWEGPEEDDPIEPRLAEIIRVMENTCQRITSGR